MSQFAKTFGKNSAFKVLASVALASLLLIPNNFTHSKIPSEVTELTHQIRKDINCMAQVIYDEARGEPLYGKIAVAEVVLNRTNVRKLSICEVINQRKGKVCQFSGMCKSGTKKVDYESLVISYNAIVKNSYPIITNGATYFHSKSVSPYWSKIYVKTIRIGNHTFYKE